MAERTNWKGLYEAKLAELATVAKDNVELAERNLSLSAENDELRDDVANLRKQIERARIKGMHDATGLLLGTERDG